MHVIDVLALLLTALGAAFRPRRDRVSENPAPAPPADRPDSADSEAAPTGLARQSAVGAGAPAHARVATVRAPAWEALRFNLHHAPCVRDAAEPAGDGAAHPGGHAGLLPGD